MGFRERSISDEHLVSEIGQLYANGVISNDEYEAGVRYGKIVLKYLETIDAPAPYSYERSDSFRDDICLTRKLNMSAARAVLRDLGDAKITRIVDRVVVYGEPVYQDELKFLRAGLRALCGFRVGAEPDRDAASDIEHRATNGARVTPRIAIIV